MPIPQTNNLPTMLLVPTASDFEEIGGRQLEPYERQRMDRMQRRVPVILDRAREQGVQLAFVGIAPLFNETRLYGGVNNDWTLGPVGSEESAVIPAEHHAAVRRLASDPDFRMMHTYIAHEVERDRTEEIRQTTSDSAAVITREQAAKIVGPVPTHLASAELADRLGEHSTRVLTAIRRGAPIAGAALLGILAAPFVVAGAIIGSLATLDPILLGAVPILRAEPGEPALFFEICRWEW